jgi:small subunit ribosomal protein S16
MPVKIRLARKGRKGLPSYNIVVADSRAPRDGKFIEKLGNYDPQKKIFNLDESKALKWLSNGAQPTDTTRNLLSKQGVMLRRHLQIGVDKGSISQNLADQRFAEWQVIKNKKESTKTIQRN